MCNGYSRAVHRHINEKVFAGNAVNLNALGDGWQVSQSKRMEIRSSFFRKFNPRKPGFVWAPVLSWQIPETYCPEDASLEVKPECDG